MNRLKFAVFVGVLTVMAAGCIDPYNLPDVDSDKKYLVVDGRVNTQSGEASVRLSLTIPLNDPGAAANVSGASVRIETSSGLTFLFNETEPGLYMSYGVFLSEGETCKLMITTTDGKTFESANETSFATPAIDSLTYEASLTDGLTIHVTTHDDNNIAKYYRWEYEETIEYTPPFRTAWYYDPWSQQVFFRPGTPLDVYYCWKTYPSTNIHIASTKDFSNSIVYKYPIVALAPDSWKHERKYSLLVRQSVISEREFKYWNELKKSTESVGSIFDPQPSRVLGNMRCTSSPSDPVLGYFSVGSIVESRIFIRHDELPYKYYSSPYDRCDPREIDTTYLVDFWANPTRYTLYEEYYNTFGALIGYTTGLPECADCRLLLGGTTQKPDFWE
jgi:hypothetical protein